MGRHLHHAHLLPLFFSPLLLPLRSPRSLLAPPPRSSRLLLGVPLAPALVVHPLLMSLSHYPPPSAKEIEDEMAGHGESDDEPLRELVTNYYGRMWTDQ